MQRLAYIGLESGMTDSVTLTFTPEISLLTSFTFFWQLRAGVLELRTPCNGNGFVKESGGDCSVQNWGFCLTNSTDMKAAICFYITRWNDCEWPGTFTLDSLPLKMGVYSKRDEMLPPTSAVGASQAGRFGWAGE